MALSNELISQLVKVTNDRGSGNKDVTVYGTVVSDGDRNYVRLDGSDISTPIETTVEVNPGDRVIVSVRNHTATVTGNTTDPAIGTKRAGEMESNFTQTAEEIRSEVKDNAAQLSSEISQTAGEIRQEISNEVEGLNTKFSQTDESISTLVKNQDEFSEFKQTVEGFSFMGEGGTVKINGGDINLTGAISFGDLSDSATKQAEIDSANTNANNATVIANNANNNAANANTVASNAMTTVSGFTITEGSQTYLDGQMIYSDSVYANSIHLGGQLTVYQSMYSNTVGGYMGYCTGWNSNAGIGIMNTVSSGQCICTDLAARLSFGAGANVVVNGTTANIDAPTWIIFKIDGTNRAYFDENTFTTYATNPLDLGRSNAPWDAVYANTCTGTTSDRNKKNSIEDLPEKYITLFDNLKPKRFKMNNGTSDRYHVGYIAQEVEEAMNAAGVDSKEFGGFIRDKDEDDNDIFLLRYGEFDAIYAAKIKRLEDRIAELEKRLAQ